MEALKKSLINIVNNIKTWMITGGTNTGVMRLIGDAVDEYLNSEDLVVIGVTELKRALRDDLSVLKTRNDRANRDRVPVINSYITIKFKI